MSWCIYSIWVQADFFFLEGLIRLAVKLKLKYFHLRFKGGEIVLCARPRQVLPLKNDFQCIYLSSIFDHHERRKEEKIRHLLLLSTGGNHFKY